MFFRKTHDLSVFTDKSTLFIFFILTIDMDFFTIDATYKECARDKPYDRRQPAR